MKQLFGERRCLILLPEFKQYRIPLGHYSCFILFMELFIEGFAVDVLAGDFFEEVMAYYHKQVFCVFVKQPFVICDIFMI